MVSQAWKRERSKPLKPLKPLFSRSLIDFRSIVDGKENFAFFESKEEPVERTKRLLLQADAVFFDVDSAMSMQKPPWPKPGTVVTTEGIDLIGKCFGIMKEISELTHKAMNGHVKFQDAMAERLQLMAEHGMTKEKLEQCVKTEGPVKTSSKRLKKA